MSMAMTCSSCNTLFHLADEPANKKRKCPKCGHSEAGITAKPNSPGKAVTDESAGDNPSGGKKKFPPPMKREAMNRKSSSRTSGEKKADSSNTMIMVIVAVAGLGFLSCIGCAGAGSLWYFWPSDQKKEIVVAVEKNKKEDRPIEEKKTPVEEKKINQPGNIDVVLRADGTYRNLNALGPADPEFKIGPFGQKRCKVYVVKLNAGSRYQIDLMSNEFDAYLYLMDEGSKILAEDDDGGGGLNSRIQFICPRTATYRIYATSLGGLGQGNYELVVRRTGAGKIGP